MTPFRVARLELSFCDGRAAPLGSLTQQVPEMFADLASMGTLLTLNLLFAGVALAVGFGLGVWFFGNSTASSAAETAQSKKAQTDVQRAAERAMMASQRIQDLAKNVVS